VTTIPGNFDHATNPHPTDFAQEFHLAGFVTSLFIMPLILIAKSDDWLYVIKDKGLSRNEKPPCINII